MKHSLQNLHHLVSASTAGLSRFVSKVGVVIGLCFVSSFTHAQDCNIIMACNDGVQVSLDETCSAEITPDAMLENQVYPNSFYTVEIIDSQGNMLPGTTVTEAQLNERLEVRVRLNNCDLTCWGYITVEDKLPPVIERCDTLTLSCTDSPLPGAPGVFGPVVSDACSPTDSISLQYFDSFVDMPCSDDFGRVITRIWVATDESGNTDTCEQIINIERAMLSDVVFPPNYDDIDQASLTCDANIPLLPNGAVDPIFSGFPEGVECPNIQYYYTDVVFDLCGASLKVLRQWFVIDWCTGEERSEPQIIKVIDNQPPICVAPVDNFTEISNDPGLCSGTFDVPPPNVIFECSDWTYTVGYKLRDANGDPFLNPIFDGIITNPDGSYSIPNLPIDTTWIVYIITDDCGNESQCFTEVVINDTEVPSPVCEGYTTIALDEIGWADMFAESIDDHSVDNCEIDRFEVRRETAPCGMTEFLEFGEYVNFCCEDIANNPIKVILRVYDQAGNFNDCVANVTVQDKRSPVVISCPADITIECGQDPNDTSITGDDFNAEDNCELVITSEIVGSLDNCGLGTIERVWTATDPQGRTATCTQLITVEDSDPFDETDIIWPNDISTTGCSGADADPELLGSIPTITNDGCTDIAISYEDEEFYNTPDVCVKILRTWRVVNWCSVNTQTPIFYEYTQKIEFTNSEAPTFVSGCDGASASPDQGECEANVSVSVTATDDCTPANQIKYSYEIDLNSNGSVDLMGNTKNFNRVLPSGMHEVTFTAEDLCGLTSSCTFTVRVSDDKAPVPICLGQVTWGIEEDGTTEIWASDFNLKSTDECSPDSLLVFAFDAQGNEQARTFTCDDIPNGIGEGIPIDMYVIDGDGNYAFCEVMLILQDNQDFCDDGNSRASVGGRIINDQGEALKSIEVELMNSTMSEEALDMTENDGDYMFEDISFYDSYIVSPEKNDDTDEGVSTLDLVLIQRHILGLSTFEDPYQYIAADINKSKSLTGSDVVELRKVILGKQSEFTNNTSWRFVDARHEFQEVEYPYDFPEKVDLGELYINYMDVDFVGVKIGDVNHSYSGNVKGDLASENRSAPTKLIIEDQNFTAGDEVEVAFKAASDVLSSGMQLAIDFGSNLAFKGLGEGSQLRSDQIALQGNSLLISKDAVSGWNLVEGEEIFTLVFETKGSSSLSDAIQINEDIMDAEIYDEDAQISKLDLIIRASESNNDGGFQLEQNVPNPFNESTTITYTIEEDGNVTISFFDISGRLLNEYKQFQTAGRHQMPVNESDLGDSKGVIYYRLEADGRSITKKMILVD